MDFNKATIRRRVVFTLLGTPRGGCEETFGNAGPYVYAETTTPVRDTVRYLRTRDA